jgi:hypothetical protein
MVREMIASNLMHRYSSERPLNTYEREVIGNREGTKIKQNVIVAQRHSMLSDVSGPPLRLTQGPNVGALRIRPSRTLKALAAGLATVVVLFFDPRRHLSIADHTQRGDCLQLGRGLTGRRLTGNAWSIWFHELANQLEAPDEVARLPLFGPCVRDVVEPVVSKAYGRSIR